MTFIHTADVHADKERFEELKKFFGKLISVCKKETIDALLISGDLTDHPLINSSSSHLVDYIDFIKELTSLTDVFLIYGTPSHEPSGCLEVFKLVGAKVLGDYFPTFSIHTLKTGETIELIGLPEPRFSLLKGESVNEKRNFYQTLLIDFIKTLPAKQNKRICMFHGEIDGASYQNNQSVELQNCIFTNELLKKMDCDYYAGGHIHKPQKLNQLNGYYPGSPCPLDFGENH